MHETLVVKNILTKLIFKDKFIFCFTSKDEINQGKTGSRWIKWIFRFLAVRAEMSFLRSEDTVVVNQKQLKSAV